MPQTSYLIALGSNRPHVRHGGPGGVVRAAIRALGEKGIKVVRVSSIHRTPALGPAGRDFANAVVTISTRLDPPALLARLKRIERDFGRRSTRRWGPRVLDLDIILWSEGVWPHRLRWRSTFGLVVPHRAMHQRAFVLAPAAQVAAEWRHPLLGVSIRQLLARLGQSRH